ncbi:replication protein RepA [Nocardia sp. NPDC051570]|uniref:replication protein RepA n=1 Tax=Nocardia sp. NPDC051570 TaxID=3364324 RepID=UPI0037B85764
MLRGDRAMLAGMSSSRDLELARAAAELWTADSQEIGYLAKLFSQTSLPYKDPGDDAPVWFRKNGALTLTVQPGVAVDTKGKARSLGYPYGTVPRLLLTWLSTEAVRTKDPELMLGASLTEFMQKIDMTPTGGSNGTITRLKRQMERLFQATLSVRVDDGDPDHQAGAKLSVASAYDLWWTKGFDDQPSLMPSTVRLSYEFFEEVTSRPVPMDLGALRALRQSPMRLDIYAWLTHRMSYLERPTTVSWELLRGQFGSNLADTKQGKQQFKRDFIRNLQAVLLVYRDANVEITDTGIMLKPSLTHVRFKGLRAIERGSSNS